jgi:uncharacterized membrane protein
MPTHTPLEQQPTPRYLWVLFRKRILPAAAWERTQEIAGFTPSVIGWRLFLDRLMLALGVVFVLAGIVFFFAFNWVGMPKFAKFGILQGATVIATGAAFWLRLESWGGRIALAAAALLLGVTLAITGQAYQTGADNYRLFMLWALMITPWVIISRWNVLWLMLVVLANTTLALFWWQVIGSDLVMLNLLLSVGNFAFFMGWVLLARTGWFGFMQPQSWFEYVLAFLLFSYITELMLEYIFDVGWDRITLNANAPIIYTLVVGVVSIYAYRIDRNLGLVSIAALSLLIVTVSLLLRGLIEAFNFTDDSWIVLSCLMGFAVIGLTAALAYGLRTLQRQWEGAEA